MTSRRGRSVKRDLFGWLMGLAFIGLFLVALKLGLVTAAANAFAQCFVHVILNQ